MNNSNGAVPTILVVDDYADTRQIVKWSLERRGYKVLEASSGREALEKSIAERPSIILMDLTMPELDGFAATQMLRQFEELRDVPIIAVTALDMAARREKAKLVGCSAFISKPIDFDRLDALIHQHVVKQGRPQTAG
jgi:two-component system, cell cycle response regulator DivK